MCVTINVCKYVGFTKVPTYTTVLDLVHHLAPSGGKKQLVYLNHVSVQHINLKYHLGTGTSAEELRNWRYTS